MATWNGWGQSLSVRKIRVWIAEMSVHTQSVEIDYERSGVTVHVVGDSYTFSCDNRIALVRMYHYAVRCMAFAERNKPQCLRVRIAQL